MEAENLKFRARAINNQIFMADKYIKSQLADYGNNFVFIDRYSNDNDMDTYFAWQIETVVEMLFVKMYVFLEYLDEIGGSDEYNINKRILRAGLRPYVAHKGTHPDFNLLPLLANKIVVAYNLRLVDGEVILGFRTGDHTQELSDANVLEVNITTELLNPHFAFVNERYPEWLSA